MDWTIPILAVWLGFVFLGRNSYYGWIQPALVLSIGAFMGFEGFGVSIMVVLLFWYVPRLFMRGVMKDDGGPVLDGRPDDMG